MSKIQGSCFCQQVRYQIQSKSGIFQYCHCSRCRKLTGSAFATNIILSPADFEWLEGEELVTRHVPVHTRYFTTAFCCECGSTLPWVAKGNKAVVVPTGTLDGDPDIRPKQQIHCDSKAPWYIPPSDLPEHEGKPSSSEKQS